MQRRDDDDCCREEERSCTGWLWPCNCCFLLLVATALLLIVFLLPLADRLVLADNTTQLLVDGNWTDVYYDETLISSPRWAHADAPVGPNARVESLAGGTYSLYIALHPAVEVELFSSADAACGVCPCTDVSCTNDTDCCSPYSYGSGEASLCVATDNESVRVCAACGFRSLGDFCNFDYECDCNNTVGGLQCLPGAFGFTFCLFPTAPPTPPPTAPYGPNCTDQSECADTQYCSPDLGLCVTCANFHDECAQDPPNQCNCTQYNNFSSPLFCDSDTLRCALACSSVADCPSPTCCSPFTDQCFSGDVEGNQCCASDADCTGSPNYYCSPTFAMCLPCAFLGDDCSLDPASQCGCNATDDLVCHPGTHRCVVGPLCPPSPTLYVRIVRQRDPNPNFVPVGAPIAPTLQGSGMYVLSTSITTDVGDVLKVQWTSPDCPLMALTPLAFDLGLIGVPGQGIQAISAYFVATNA